MKYGVVVVLLIASAMAQDKLTVKQCRADLDKLVPMFKAAYENVKATVGQIVRLSTRSECCSLLSS